MSDNNASVAFLLFEKPRHKQSSAAFDDGNNMGVHVVRDVLERAGVRVGYCTPETAKHFRVVLVSFTSKHDVIELYRRVSKRADWQRPRSFVAIGGGSGMQNPVAIRNLLDMAVFGRSEAFVAELVVSTLDAKPFEHPSVMHLPDVSDVEIAQAPCLYPNRIIGPDKRHIGGWSEASIGCKNKCMFCHYAFTRKTLAGNSWNDSGNTESTLLDLVNAGATRLRSSIKGQLVTALDGTSERLRCLFGKPIKAHHVTALIELLADAGVGHIVKLFNIGNFPTESKSDWDELRDCCLAANPRAHVRIAVQTTPFQPEPLTPMQWEAVRLFPNLKRMEQSPIARTGNVEVFHGRYVQGPMPQLSSALVARATPQTDAAFAALCMSSKLRAMGSEQGVRALLKSFDLSPVTREYEIGEQLPTWFLRSYTPTHKIERMAQRMRARPEYANSKG